MGLGWGGVWGSHQVVSSSIHQINVDSSLVSLLSLQVQSYNYRAHWSQAPSTGYLQTSESCLIKRSMWMGLTAHQKCTSGFEWVEWGKVPHSQQNVASEWSEQRSPSQYSFRFFSVRVGLKRKRCRSTASYMRGGFYTRKIVTVFQVLPL